MLKRISFCLIFAFASAVAMARDVKHSSAAGGSCADAATAEAQANARPRTRTLATPPAATRPAKPRPSVHGDAPSRPSLRWHSFLPGMFR